MRYRPGSLRLDQVRELLVEGVFLLVLLGAKLTRQGGGRRCRAIPGMLGQRAIGGFGDIRVRDDLDPGDDHLVVVGGSDQFDGVAGKLTIHNLTERVAKYHFDLVR
jgi:hypothetical protein